MKWKENPRKSAAVIEQEKKYTFIIIIMAILQYRQKEYNEIGREKKEANNNPIHTHTHIDDPETVQ